MDYFTAWEHLQGHTLETFRKITSKYSLPNNNDHNNHNYYYKAWQLWKYTEQFPGLGAYLAYIYLSPQ